MEDKVQLIYGNKTHEFPLVKGTENEIAIDIKSLRAETGLITLDPGYKNSGSCKSEITFLDGEKGILRYRGYSIEDLANKSSFLEVVYLLIFGELPTPEQLSKIEDEIREESLVDEDLKAILKSFPKGAHPMGILSSLTSALIAFNPSSVDINSGSGKKLIEKNQINDARIAKNLQGTYGYLKDFIPSMQEKAAKTPSGAVGGTLAFIDSVSDQFDQLGEFTGIKNSKISFGSATDKFLQSKGFDRDVANYAKLKGSVTKLGYSLAKSEEPDNPRLSEGDVLRQLDRINFGGSRNQFVNSLQGILEDEYIAGKAKYRVLDPKGEWGFEDPRNKTATGSDIGANTTNQGLEEDILGYFQ